MTLEELFSNVKNLKTNAERRRAHMMLDVANVPRGMTLEQRVDLLTWRYPMAQVKS